MTAPNTPQAGTCVCSHAPEHHDQPFGTCGVDRCGCTDYTAQPASPIAAPVEGSSALARALIEQAGDRQFLVWSYQHHAWWGPANQGYHIDMLNAGLYTADEARRIIRPPHIRGDPLHGHSERAYALADVLAGRIWERKPGCVQDVATRAFEQLHADNTGMRADLDTIALNLEELVDAPATARPPRHIEVPTTSPAHAVHVAELELLGVAPARGAE